MLVGGQRDKKEVVELRDRVRSGLHWFGEKYLMADSHQRLKSINYEILNHDLRPIFDFLIPQRILVTWCRILPGTIRWGQTTCQTILTHYSAKQG